MRPSGRLHGSFRLKLEPPCVSGWRVRGKVGRDAFLEELDGTSDNP
jgi:hypothetical protein